MGIFVSNDGSKLNFVNKGEGKPILFFHGWSVDLLLWLNKIESIPGNWKNNYKRIYLDLPGMGKSIASKKVKNSNDVLTIIEEFIDYMIPDSNYLLAGESYGGYLARGLLSIQKKRIDGLFLLCPLIFPGWRKGRFAQKQVLEKDDAFLNSLSKDEKEEFEFLSIIQTKEMWLDYKKDIILDVAEGNEGFLEHQLDGAFTPSIDISSIDYEKPTLILLGRQDTEVGFEDQYDLYKTFKRATIQILDKAGHNLQIERNDLFNASFLDWIERIETNEENL